MKTATKAYRLQKTQNYFRRNKFIVKIFALFCLNLILINISFSQTTDPKLTELRNQFAVDYLKPEAHFALAQYYLKKDNKLQAFFIMEYARRGRFPQKDFDAAFKTSFGENSAEPSDKAKQAFEKGYEFLKVKKLDEAEQSFLAAAELAPKSAFIQSWVGRFFYKAKPNNVQALKYYLNAYFLDPHSYETEFVESRIRNIALADADARFTELLKNGKTLPEILTDANPLIVGKAVDQIAKQWKNEYVEPLLGSMTNDDSLVRWFSFVTVFKNAGASSDKIILTLSNAKDLRKRGLAAYGLIELQKEKSFDALKKMLTENAELIRFDALSALALQGGTAGLEILRAHRKVEKNPRLVELIDLTLVKK
jgi:tetratricopeptide (TPR) repeat protein